MILSQSFTDVILEVLWQIGGGQSVGRETIEDKTEIMQGSNKDLHKGCHSASEEENAD